jgi:subfamily B ATP-binding cassette protein HlyB/CyaB
MKQFVIEGTVSLDLQEIKRLLKETTAFSILSEDELDDFAASCELAHYTLGQTICRKGDHSDSFFIVYSGRARVVGENANGEEVSVGILTRGNSFGEQGLLTNTERQFTVRAAGDLVLLRLTEQEFESILPRHPELETYFKNYISENSIRNFLKLCTVFAPLSPADIRSLLSCLHTKEYEKGATVVKEGEPGDAYYIIRSGSATVVLESQGNRVVRHLKTGDGFGELALLTGHPRAATVITNEPSSLFRLEKNDFDRLITSAPQVKEAVVSMVSGYSEAVIREADSTSTQNGADTLSTPELPAAPPMKADDYKPKRAKKYPALLQFSETDCGAASLAMILRYYGKHVSINRLRELANVGRDGASLYSLSEAAEALGFEARGVRVSPDHLQKVELPAIAHWEGFHYIVLYEVTPTHVIVADPAMGLRRLTQEEFSKGWTGYLLLMKPTPKMEEVEETPSSFGKFWPILKPYRGLLIEIGIATLLLQLFGLASPIFTQVIIDRVLVHKSVSMLNTMLVGMMLIAVFQAVTISLRQYLMVHTARRIDLTMVVGFYQHLLSLPLRFFEERKVGDILKRLQENAKIRHILTGKALGVILDCFMMIVYIALMFFYSAKLALLAMAFMPGYVILTLMMTPVLRRQFRESFIRLSEAESHVVESVTGIGTVKATAAERRIRWRLEGLLVKALNVEFRGAMTNTAATGFAAVLQTLQTVVLFWYGAHLVLAEELSIGQLVAFNVLVANITRPVLNLIDLWRDFQEVKIAFERLDEVLDAKPEQDANQRGAMRLPPIKGHIKFENVTFRYPSRPDKNILQNIDLEVLPGQTVALVGRSGAGKTTFASLLLRLHEPTSGKILIDGYDTKQVTLNSLRAQIGVVPQEVFLFSGTIRENIAFGEQDARLEEVVGAAMLAGAHEFISELPLGYETEIGERGQSMSGGQRQRIAIARAIYKKPRILIFDEATSALDTESERAIQQNLTHILKDRTTFIIAHRLSTVQNADLIIVLDQGHIVEAGNHYALMEQRGLYYYLNSQQLEV